MVMLNRKQRKTVVSKANNIYRTLAKELPFYKAALTNPNPIFDMPESYIKFYDMMKESSSDLEKINAFNELTLKLKENEANNDQTKAS